VSALQLSRLASPVSPVWFTLVHPRTSAHSAPPHACYSVRAPASPAFAPVRATPEPTRCFHCAALQLLFAQRPRASALSCRRPPGRLRSPARTPLGPASPPAAAATPPHGSSSRANVCCLEPRHSCAPPARLPSRAHPRPPRSGATALPRQAAQPCAPPGTAGSSPPATPSRAAAARGPPQAAAARPRAQPHGPRPPAPPAPPARVGRRPLGPARPPATRPKPLDPELHRVEEKGGMEPGVDRNGGKSMCRRWGRR
jgi:hypothetical protein